MDKACKKLLKKLKGFRIKQWYNGDCKFVYAIVPKQNVEDVMKECAIKNGLNSSEDGIRSYGT